MFGVSYFTTRNNVHTFADGMYMMEVDRVLRPGGYWVLSGPPINWKVNYKGWQRTKKDLEAEQNRIEEIADLLCWEKVSEKGEMAIWRKRVNTESCPSRQEESAVQMCESTNPDDVWYAVPVILFQSFEQSVLVRMVLFCSKFLQTAATSSGTRR
jgi:hypothetical protein